MQQFDLSVWLKDKSRKVVTRDGREVSIERTDLRGHFPILAIISNNSEDYDIPMTYNNKGKNIDTECEGIADLFFADEEDELTEFEARIYNLINFSDPYNYPSIKEVKEEAEILLDLARNELEANYYTKVLDDRVVFKSDLHDRDMQGAYELGKQDALKNLPKWKKATEKKDLEKHIAILEENKVLLSNYLEEGDYYIDLEDLKALPKEE